MEIYRLSCVVMLFIMLGSGLLLVFFPKSKHRENTYMQVLNNLNVGFFSGLMVSFSLTLVAYFYSKQTFLENLFQQSRYIYNNSILMENELNAEITDVEEVAKKALIIQEDAKKVNFLNFSPFMLKSKNAESVKKVENLFVKFEKYPELIKSWQKADEKKVSDMKYNIKKEITENTAELYSYITYLHDNSNSRSYRFWENVEEDVPNL